MATTTQHQDHALLFLSNHSLEEAEHFGLNINKQTLNHDPSATITVSGDKIVVEYTVPDSDAKRIFTSQPPYSFYTLKIPNTQRTGHLYFRGHPPSQGESKFWIQQYPPYLGGDGRLIVEFWTDNQIAAMFKTDDNNFGAAGAGSWD